MSTAETVSVSVDVNGTSHHVVVPARMTVADLLREEFGLTGTHLGCEQGVCGACTILLDDVSVRSCLLFAGQVDGHSLDTVERLAADDGSLHPIQEAFHQAFGLQCGFCTPGFLMAAVELLKEIEHPDEAEIRSALSGNICRCTGYDTIVDAVQRAAKTWTRS